MDILSFINDIVSMQQIQALGGLLIANFALGILAAIKMKEFQFAKVKDIGVRAVSMFVTYFVIAIAANSAENMLWLREVIWGALITYMTTQVITNIQDLTGIKIPQRIMNIIEKK